MRSPQKKSKVTPTKSADSAESVIDGFLNQSGGRLRLNNFAVDSSLDGGRPRRRKASRPVQIENLPSKPEVIYGEVSEAASKRITEYFGKKTESGIEDKKLKFISENLGRLNAGLLTRLYNALNLDPKDYLPVGADGRYIPDTAPALWKDVPRGRGPSYVSPATFIVNVYGNWLATGVFGEDHLSMLDPKLLAAYKIRIRNHPQEKIPGLHPSSKAEREAAEFYPLLTKKDFIRIGAALSSRIYRRGPTGD